MFRADGGPEIGSGHVMRSLALAAAWCSSGGRAEFVSHSADGDLLRRLNGLGIAHSDPGGRRSLAPDREFTAGRVRELSAAWVVVDGYEFDIGYYADVRAAGARLCVIDDGVRLDRYEVDLLIDQNADATGRAYPTGASDVCLLGPDFAQLRPEFVNSLRDGRTIPENVNRILVTMGGSDPTNLTMLAIDALADSPDLGHDVVVVVGPGNEQAEEIRARISGIPGVRYLQSPENMAEVMASVDLAVASAGSSMLEMAFLGLPAIVLVAADNQVSGAKGFSELGAVVNLGPGDEDFSELLRSTVSSVANDRPTREAMSRRGMATVDGRGAQRVVDEMLRISDR